MAADEATKRKIRAYAAEKGIVRRGIKTARRKGARGQISPLFQASASHYHK